MKKLLLLTLLIALSFVMKADDFTFKHGDDDINFHLVTNKINIRLKSDMTQTDMLHVLKNEALITDRSDQGYASNIWVVQLDKNYTLPGLGKLISDLDKNNAVDFASPLLDYNGDRVAMTTQILMKISPDDDQGELDDICTTDGLTDLGTRENLPEGVHVIQLPRENILRQFDYVHDLADISTYSQPNLLRFMSLQSIYNDPKYSSQYALTHINAPDTWTTNHHGTPTVRVAVLDVGVDLTHVELAGGQLVYGFDAMSNTGSAASQSGNTFGGYVNNDSHGTACAGVIAAKANNNAGIVGLAYGSTVVPVRMGKILSHDSILTDDIILASAILYAYNHADVLSNSWGGGAPSQVVEDAISDAVIHGRTGKGCPVFFAAGNKSSATLPWPAYLPEVIAVGATTNDASDHKASFSNYSTFLDISAPGNLVMTTDLSGAAGQDSLSGAAGDYDNFSGTSFSCPYAAALMALIITANPVISEADARNSIESTCREAGGYSYYSDPFHPSKKWSDELGYGIIDAQSAVTKAISFIPGSTTTPTPVATLTAEPGLICSGINATDAYFDLKVTGGRPNQDITGVYHYFSLNFYKASTFLPADASPYLPNSNMIVSTTDPVNFPASNTKRFYLNLTGISASQFPLTVNIYVDVIDTLNTHHHSNATLSMVIQHAPDFTLAPQIYGCEGQSIWLQPYVTVNNPGLQTSYSWNMGPFTTTMPNIPGSFVEPGSGSGTIALTLTNGNNGCILTRSAHVDFVDPVIGGNANSKNICVGSAPTPMGATASAAMGGAFTYSWSPTSGLSNPNILNPDFTMTGAPGIYNYQLTATTSFGGCTKTANFTVEVRAPQSSILVTSDINNACPGHPVVLTGTITGPYSVYSPVYFTDGTANLPTAVSGVTATTTVNPMTTTTYSLVAIDPYGCQASNNTVNVTVNPNPLFIASAGPDLIVCTTPISTITPRISGGLAPYTYLWMPGNLTTHTFDVPNATQTYTLTVTDATGCVVKDQVTATGTSWMFTGYTVIHNICTGQAIQLVPDNNDIRLHWTNGGTPPYTYEWFPHSYFSNPYDAHPTTVSITQTIFPWVVTTDSNGCQSRNNQYLIAYENTSPDLFINSDPCGSKDICITPGGGLQYKGETDPTDPGRAIDSNNLPAGSAGKLNILTSYSFNPAPLSQTATCATFAPGTSSVDITVNQSLGWPITPGYSCPTTSTSTYTFPAKDDARHLLITLPNSDIIYVGTDQLLHRLRWNIYAGWQYSTFMPTNGWGGIRVEGWLAQNENSTRIFFKSTTGQLNSIANYAGTDDWLLEGYTIGVNVKSDIAYRETAGEIYYIGTDNKVHRVYWLNHNWHYDAITPVGGWQSIAADSYLTLENAPGTHVFFKTMDNRIFNFWGGTVSSPNMSDMLVSGCGGDIINNPATGGLYFKTLTSKIHKLDWNGSTWAESVINPINNGTYTVDGYLTVDPTTNQVFYKAPDRTIHFINLYGGSYYDDVVDVNQNQTAGDLVYFDSKLIYIHRDKTIHQYMLNGTGFVDAQVNHTPANVKACSYEFRALMIAGDPDDDGSPNQPTAITGDAMYPTLVNVYPNPSEGQFTIEINSGTTAVIDVYNAVGTKIRTIQKEKDKAIYELDLTGYARGIYMVNVLSDGKHTSKKIMIK